MDKWFVNWATKENVNDAIETLKNFATDAFQNGADKEAINLRDAVNNLEKVIGEVFDKQDNRYSKGGELTTRPAPKKIYKPKKAQK